MIDKNSIPAHWEVKKLGELVKTTSGGTPSRRELKFYNGNIPWVKSGELNKGLILDTEEKISEEAIINSSAKVFPKGTLLIALYGATIGKLAFLGVEAATNQAICGIYKNENISSYYLYYYLFFSKPQLLKQSIGGAQPNISQGILKDLDVPFPPLSEQQEIVAKIEELLSELDQGKKQLETARQQLKVYRQAVLKWAFEGKFTNPEIKEGELPEDWKLKKLGEVAKFIDYRGKTPVKTSFGIPLITAKNVKMGFINEEPREFIAETNYDSWMTRGFPKKGDILFTTEAPLGNVAQLKTDSKIALAQRMITFQSFNFLINSFLKYSLMSPQFQELLNSKGTGTTVKGIKAAVLKQLEIPIPPLEEQKQIVQEIESRLSVCDNVEETIAQSLQQAETLRQSILKQAFEGKLVFDRKNLLESI